MPLDESALESIFSAPELGAEIEMGGYGLPVDIYSMGLCLVALWSPSSHSMDDVIDVILRARKLGDGGRADGAGEAGGRSGGERSRGLGCEEDEEEKKEEKGVGKGCHEGAVGLLGLARDTPPGLEGVIGRMIARNAGLRPDAHAVLVALQEVVENALLPGRSFLWLGEEVESVEGGGGREGGEGGEGEGLENKAGAYRKRLARMNRSRSCLVS